MMVKDDTLVRSISYVAVLSQLNFSRVLCDGSRHTYLTPNI